MSEYKAKVYVCLVREWPSRAMRPSMVCGVPRTKVYGILKKLVERGLMVEIPEESRMFVSTSPSNAFKSFLKSYGKKARDLYVVASFLENAYEKTRVENKP